MCIRDRPAPGAVARIYAGPLRVPSTQPDAAVGTGAEGGLQRPDEEAEPGLTEVGACDIPRQLQTESTSSRTRWCPVAERLETIYINRCGVEAVSYTHLRAHETVLDLVCRL